ncbi:hypothetical protein JYG23_12445 [Sedimentibacter sp. zth1]|uniref:hypothetical protein n=1 Tax=Sedimentibacter sp. zth1 TaxID=2816908 RepID=UPI001A927B10|nr:hypothetical protein [Sedimentibacter sp. zth1]QSX05478.1 hypothetical protein JYG23_12445 [Sedimentibacter sp. zth1]
MASRVQVKCKNVFKNKDDVLLKDDFNKKFVELINQIEKNKTGIIFKEDLQVITSKV